MTKVRGTEIKIDKGGHNEREEMIIEKERREINGVTNCWGNNRGKQSRIFQNQKF